MTFLHFIFSLYTVHDDKDRVRIGKILLDAGADPNLSDSVGRTPAFYTSNETIELLRALLDKGADPNPECMRLLIDKGVPMGLRPTKGDEDAEGWRPRQAGPGDPRGTGVPPYKVGIEI